MSAIGWKADIRLSPEDPLEERCELSVLVYQNGIAVWVGKAEVSRAASAGDVWADLKAGGFEAPLN